MPYLYQNERFIKNIYKNPSVAIIEIINESRKIKAKAIKNQDFEELENVILNGSLPLILSVLNTFKDELKVDIDIDNIELKLNAIENLFDSIYHKVYPLTKKAKVINRQKEFEKLIKNSIEESK
jgi:hypothetical protein